MGFDNIPIELWKCLREKSILLAYQAIQWDIKVQEDVKWVKKECSDTCL